MGSRATRARFEAIRTLAYGSIGASYAQIGTPIVNPARLIKVDNLTNATLMFSTNGLLDQFVLPSGGFMLIDICSDKTHDDGLFLPTGEGMFVKEIGTPTSGSVYFTVMYGSES